ncbi:MAG: MFS transporter, partial [Pseudomonadota bacterium]
MTGKSGSWALIAALAGFLFGFDTAVISGAEQAVQKVWAMSDALHGLAISSALWGTVIGALLGGWPSDRWGRRPTLIAIGVFYAISALGSALAWDPLSFIVFRVLGGLAIGVSSVTAPAYIAEIAQREQRGRLVALFQTMIVLGILVAFLSNFLLGNIGQIAPIIGPMLVANAASNEPIANPTRAKSIIRSLPILSPMRPMIGV